MLNISSYFLSIYNSPYQLGIKLTDFEIDPANADPNPAPSLASET